MADAIGGNPWQNFFNNFGNNDPADDGVDNDANELADLPDGDALDDADENLDETTAEYEEYLKAENMVVAKSIQTFAPIFKSFIDQAIEMKE